MTTGCLQALMWWSGKTVQSVFAAWLAATKERQRTQLCKVRAIFSYSNLLQRKAFHSWQEGIAFRQARQQRLALVFEDMAGRRLCLAFDAWCVHTALHRPATAGCPSLHAWCLYSPLWHDAAVWPCSLRTWLPAGCAWPLYAWCACTALPYHCRM